ncbi:MAG TPA: HEAT repeat domain-containing protein [Gemmataceae bacterium]|nr:HEAT repeat domain-containing protein [Gemmataceae bacterium]
MNRTLLVSRIVFACGFIAGGFSALHPLWLFADEPVSNDPIERLQRALHDEPQQVLQNDPGLAKRVAAFLRQKGITTAGNERRYIVALELQQLRSLPQIRQALLLRNGWPFDVSNDQSPDAAAINGMHDELGKRFVEESRRILKSGSQGQRLAILTMISTSATQIRTADQQKGLGRVLGRELAEVVEHDPDIHVREAGTRALGEIFPDPGLAVKVLSTLLDSKETSMRRAGAKALASLVRVASELANDNTWPTRVQAKRTDVAQAGLAVLPLISRAVADADAGVRREGVEAVRQVALALVHSEERRRSYNPEDTEAASSQKAREAYTLFLPMARVLSDQVPTVGQRLHDREPEVTQAANQALEALADARTLWLRLSTLAAVGKEAEDPLGGVLRSAAPLLGNELANKNLQIRLGALYALESLEALAVPAIDPVVKALKDENPFVRWAAARTLGKIAPLEPEKAVPGLAVTVNDANGDVRLSTLVALNRYGSAAKAAVPALDRAVSQGSRDLRALTIQTLAAIGPSAKPTLPTLIKALSAKEAPVREAAAKALGAIAPTAPEAAQALLKALDDSNSDVRQAASDALLVIQ